MLLSKPSTNNMIYRLAKRSKSSYPIKPPPPEIAEYARQYGFTPPGAHHNANPYRSHGGHGGEIWMKVAMVAIPVTILAAIRAFYHEYEEEKHVMEHRPEFVPVEFLRIRRTPFPWGDGNHTLFHNPKRNPLPEGYEEVEN